MSNIHVYPVVEEQDHNLNRLECKCGPEYEVLCTQCEPLGNEPCWKCNGERIVRVKDLNEAREHDGNVIIIHKGTVFVVQGEELDLNDLPELPLDFTK